MRASGINKRASYHTLRYSFAAHLVEAGYDIRTVLALLGRRDVSTTMVSLWGRGSIPVQPAFTPVRGDGIGAFSGSQDVSDATGVKHN